MKISQVEPGMRVRYVPGHAQGDMRHKDCEDGIVTSKKVGNVFVCYRIGAVSQSTSVNELVPLDVNWDLIKTTCPGCKREIDPETCHCGLSIDHSSMGEGHMPVPMGCVCGYVSSK